MPDTQRDSHGLPLKSTAQHRDLTVERAQAQTCHAEEVYHICMQATQETSHLCGDVCVLHMAGKDFVIPSNRSRSYRSGGGCSSNVHDFCSSKI